MLGAPYRALQSGDYMTLPLVFCWTKFGVESGENTDVIFDRKDRERQLNGGTFLWGIGNSVGPSLLALLRRTTAPVVVFTPIISRPSPTDVNPERVVEWTSARGLDGMEFDIPACSKVVSRAVDGPRGQRHYSLVCSAPNDLREVNVDAQFGSASVRNLVSGSPVGSSQVTSVVESTGEDGGRAYSVRVVAELVYPYMLELSRPVLVPAF